MRLVPSCTKPFQLASGEVKTKGRLSHYVVTQPIPSGRRQGLCNGTQLVVKALYESGLDAMILGGQFHGENRYIPRILLTNEMKEGFIVDVISCQVMLCNDYQ
jgi:hypothetical protein